MASRPTFRTGVSNGYNWGDTENGEAIRKALKEVENELDSGEAPVRFDPRMTILDISDSKPVGAANTYRDSGKAPSDVTPLRMRHLASSSYTGYDSKSDSKTKVSHATASPRGHGIVSLAGMRQRLLGSVSGASKTSGVSHHRQDMSTKHPDSEPLVLQLPKSYADFYPSHVGMHDAITYMEAIDKSGILDTSLDEEGGGGASVTDMVAMNVSLHTLRKGHSAILVLEHRKVYRSYKINRDPVTKEKTIKIYNSYLPGNHYTAHDKSQAYFETYCIKRRAEFEATLKIRASRSDSVPRYEGCAASGPITVSTKADALPSPPGYTITDEDILDELLAVDPPSPPAPPAPTTERLRSDSPLSMESDSAWDL